MADRPSIGVEHVLTVLFAGVLLLAPLLLIAEPLGPEADSVDPVVAVLSWGIIVYSAARMVIFCWRARPRWAESVFWAFSYVWLGLASLAQVMAGRDPMSASLSSGTQTVQLGMVLAGFVAFDLGVHLRRRLVPRSEDQRSRVWTLSTRRVAALGVVTVVTTPFLVMALGGLGALFRSRQAVEDFLAAKSLYSSTSHAGGGTLTVVATVLPFAAALTMFCLWQVGRWRRHDRAFVVLFVALLGANVVLNNPISNPRSWFFTIVIAILLCLRFMTRRAMKIGFVVFFIAAAAFAFPYADAFRTNQIGVTNQTRSESGLADLMVGSTDYGAITDVGLAVKYVEDHGHTKGRQLLGAAAFWVPRTLWPEKAPNTAELLADEIHYPNRNLDTPLWAEGYIDFGIPGTVVVLAVFGALVRRIDDTLEAAESDWSRHGRVAFPIAVSFVGYESFLLRGSLLQAMAKIVMVIGLLALVGVRRPGSEG